jgi:hypothetical protein
LVKKIEGILGVNSPDICHYCAFFFFFLFFFEISGTSLWRLLKRSIIQKAQLARETAMLSGGPTNRLNDTSIRTTLALDNLELLSFANHKVLTPLVIKFLQCLLGGVKMLGNLNAALLPHYCA